RGQWAYTSTVRPSGAVRRCATALSRGALLQVFGVEGHEEGSGAAPPRGLKGCWAGRPGKGRPDGQRISSESRYERTLRPVSSTESPPNFSMTASARTSATIASATTPEAGTAVTSLRWWWA